MEEGERGISREAGGGGKKNQLGANLHSRILSDKMSTVTCSNTSDEFMRANPNYLINYTDHSKTDIQHQTEKINAAYIHVAVKRHIVLE